MQSAIDILISGVGLIAIAVAGWQFLLFLTAKQPGTEIPDMMYGVNHLWWAVVTAVIAIACMVAFFVRHPRTEEEIHVTG